MVKLSIISIIILFNLIDTNILPAETARILAVETIGGKSHWNFMSAVLQSLVNNGHNVTVFTPFLDGNRENYTEVDTSNMFEIMVALGLLEAKELFANKFRVFHTFMKINRLGCEALYNNIHMKEILKNNFSTNYDVIFIEPGISGCLTYIATITDLPLIYVIPTPIIVSTERSTIGDISNPATVSSLLADYALPKSFNQRFSNFFFLLYINIIVKLHEKMLVMINPKSYDVSTPVPPSLIFQNGHFISDMSRPISANIINIGGIHLKPVEYLPKDILEFIENSPNGVILFTFGSTISIKSIPENIKNAFLNALAQLPQNVLLKYEGQLENKPKNIMTKKWFPQRDILMHPNVKLFISHGGISGLYEAVDAGVPILGFPLLGDQPRNIDHLVEAGMATSMEISEVTQEAFLNNVIEIINNEKYKNNAKKASIIFKDRPISPEKAVVYWTEYVIRHKGAPHLKSHALNLSWYQYFLLDVITVMLTLFFFVLYLIFKVIQFIYKCTFKNLHTIKTKSE